MYQPVKAQNIVQEIKRLQNNVLGINETRWLNSGKGILKNKTLFYSGCGSDDYHHRHGVVIILNLETDKSVISFV